MSNVSIIELGKYTTPKIEENKRKAWVEYGADNNYYQVLLDAKQSPTNSALINGITDMIYGKGLKAHDAARKPDEYAQALSLFTEDCLRKLTDDYYTFGQAALQVIYDQSHTKVVEVYHCPIQNIRPEKCNDEGDIEAYYYHDNWKDLKANEQPERIPAFGYSNEGLEILCIKPYRGGYHYFSPVEYQSGLDYAFVEVELAAFHLNNIHNRFSANTIINFNNGVPEPDEQRSIEQKIKAKYQGSEGDGIIVAFNDAAENAASVESVSLSDAHNQYQFIADEAARKIMVSHRVVSPLLFGLPQNGGLGSNADEIRMASQLFDNTVIKQNQRVIIDGLQQILHFNDIALKLYFETSQPIEFSDVEVKDLAPETTKEITTIDTTDQVAKGQISEQEARELIEKEASYNGAQIASAIAIMNGVAEGSLSEDQAITFLVQMLQFDPKIARALFSGYSSKIIASLKKHSSDKICCSAEGSHLEKVAEKLIGLGELIDEDEWELIEETPVDYDNDTNLFRKQERTILQRIWNFVSTGTANPDQASEQDTGLYKVRYSYAPAKVSANSRDFCSQMVSAGKVYRKEDIVAMESEAVNAGFGPNGDATYNIWFYKGGPNCHHYWMRKVYMRKRDSKGQFLPNEGLANDKQVSVNEARRAGVPLAQNPSEVAKLPVDMPNNGYLNPR